MKLDPPNSDVACQLHFHSDEDFWQFGLCFVRARNAAAAEDRVRDRVLAGVMRSFDTLFTAPIGSLRIESND